MSRKPASPGALMAVLFFGVLMGALDIAIVAPALHPIQQEFGTTPRWTAWIFSIYMLFSLIGTPLMAKLADLYGRRLVYVSNIALFAFGSLVVVAGGLTGQFWVFLAGRAVQGLGAGGIFPVAAAVIGDTVAPEKRGSALGLLGAVWGLAFILGPILGGLLIPFGWTWLFLINLPIAVALVIGALLVLPSHKKGDTPPLDFRALILLAGALASFALGVNQLDTAHPLSSFLSASVWPYLALSLVLLVGLILSERKKTVNPFFPHHLFGNRQLTLVYIIGAVYGFLQSSISFLPALAMAAFEKTGMTSSQSSYLLLPMVLAMSVASPLVGRLLDKIGSQKIILAGVLISVAAFLLLGLAANSLPWYIAGEFLLGLGVAALAGAPLRYIVLAETPASDRGVAQGLSSIFISVGGVIGSALIGGGAASASDPYAGWSFAFLMIALPCALAAILALFLKGQSAERATAQRNHT